MHAFKLPESVSFYHVVPKIKTSSLLTCCAISPAHKYRLKDTLKSNDTDIQNKSSDWLKFLCSLWEDPSNNKNMEYKNQLIQWWLAWAGVPSSPPHVSPSPSHVLERGGWPLPEIGSPFSSHGTASRCEASCALTRPQLLQCTQQYLVPVTEVTPSIFPSYRGTKLEVSEKVLGILNLWKQSKHIRAYF